MKRKRLPSSPGNAPASAAPTATTLPRHDFASLSLTRAAREDFKKWKRTLTRMIECDSQITSERCGSDEHGQPIIQYRFLLPPKLVKLVWETTIQERTRLWMRGGEDEQAARRHAVDELRAKVEELAKQAVGEMGSERPQTRKAKRQVSGEWVDCAFEDLKKGDIFKVFEDDDTPIDSGQAYLASCDAFLDPRKVWTIAGDPVVPAAIGPTPPSTECATPEEYQKVVGSE